MILFYWVSKMTPLNAKLFIIEVITLKSVNQLMKKIIISLAIIAFLAIATMAQFCPKGCSACTGRSCSGCDSGYVRNATSSQCIPCGKDCSACTLADNVPTCTTCITATNVIFGGKCAPCSPSCVPGQCSGDPKTCTQCHYGVTPASGVCTYQTNCIEGCGRCPDTSTCTVCKRGYYKDGSNICQKCSSSVTIGPQCVSCTGASTCQTCQKGFYVDGSNICQACPSHALVCTSSAVSICEQGFRANANTCEACTPPCMTCSSSVTTCTSCIKPATLHMGNVCRACKSPCLTCEASPNDGNCLTCVQGFSMKANAAKQCFRCKQRLCRMCDEADTSKCIQCEMGAALNSTANCNPCPVGCAECNPNKQKDNQREAPTQARLLQQPRFLQSQQGRFLQQQPPQTNQQVNADNDNIGGGNSTDRRIPGNKPARPTYDCIRCEQGSVLVQGRCKQCQVKGCLECDPNQKGICLKCLDGSFLDDKGKCRKCQRGCQLCSEPKNCDRLFKGWVQIQGGDIVRCRPGCDKCTPADPTVCSMCADGNYLVPTTSICTMCPAASNCRTCNPSTPATCLTCRKDDHLIGGVCQSCDSSCLTCAGVNADGLKTCLTCPKGSFKGGPSDNQCITASSTCGQNAIRCSRTDNTKCEECRYGYTCSDQGKCAKCLGGCSKCAYKAEEIGQVCLGCPRGFEKNGTKCVACPSGADICVRGQSIICLPQFELREINNEIQCVPKCQWPCTNCTRAESTDGVRNETCDECQRGYTLDANKKCVPTNCGSSCTNCVLGTFKSGSSCPACTVANCVSCADATAVCYACSQGFFLATDKASCQPCSTGCWKCDGPNRCEICAIGFFRMVKEDSEYGTDDTEALSCSPCEPECLTCIGTNNTCTSCKPEFQGNGTRCRSKLFAGIKVKFETEYNSFNNDGKASDVQAAVKAKCRERNQTLNTNGLQNEYTEQGSSVSEDTISIPAGTDPASMVGTITDGYNAAGIPILSIDVAIYDQTGARINTVNVGMIIGIVLGSVALVAIIITIGVCIWWRRKKAAQLSPLPNEGSVNIGQMEMKAY